MDNKVTPGDMFIMACPAFLGLPQNHYLVVKRKDERLEGWSVLCLQTGEIGWEREAALLDDYYYTRIG